MTNSATFWTILAVVTFPVLLLMGLFCALAMGPNLVLLPAWTLVALAWVGGFTNEIARCRSLVRRSPEQVASRRRHDLITAHP